MEKESKIEEIKKVSLDDKKIQNSQTQAREDFCKCLGVSTMYSDTESSDFGYWDVCGSCNKKIEDGFHYYNHYDGEDHDDIDLYCDDNF